MNDKDREAFEKWGSTVARFADRISKHRDHNRPNEYYHNATQDKWAAWQAALAYERNDSKGGETS